MNKIYSLQGKYSLLQGRVFRSPIQSLPNKTVADVLRYEIEELGNDIHFPGQFWEFSRFPASRCTWVTRTITEAKRYGRPVVTLLVAAPILGSDDEGGYLIFLDKPASQCVVAEESTITGILSRLWGG